MNSRKVKLIDRYSSKVVEVIEVPQRHHCLMQKLKVQDAIIISMEMKATTSFGAKTKRRTNTSGVVMALTPFTEEI